MLYPRRGNRKSQRSVPGDMDMFVQIVQRDSSGRIRYKKTQKCYSFVDNFLRVIFSYMGRDAQDVKDTSNTSRTLDVDRAHNRYLRVGAGVGETNNGIVIGSGSTAVDINDYSIETLIDDGTSSGEMQYSNLSTSAPTTDASTTSFVLSRVFSNASGGAIAVKEVALYTGTYGGGVTIMHARDLINGGTGVSVPDGDDITINYKVKTTI